ncbi:MAG: ATP-binding protein [bacterium]
MPDDNAGDSTLAAEQKPGEIPADRSEDLERLKVTAEQLRERIKELDCLYAISQLVEQRGALSEQIFQGIVDLVHPAFRFPDLTCARIVIEGKSYQSQNFREGGQTYACSILVGDVPVGRLEVGCPGRGPGGPDPFLAEEKSLVNAIAERIARIVERREAERALQRSREQLYQAQKIGALGVLVAGVAHEINNPINLIKLNIRLLQRVWRDIQPVLRERAKIDPGRKYGGLTYDFLENSLGRLLADMDMAVSRAAGVVADLREFARKSDVNATRPLSINEAVENALRLVQPALRKSGVEVAADFGQRLPRIDGDLPSVEQITVNLLTNAIRSIDHGHGRIEVTTGTEAESGRVFLSVSDNGRGIDPAIADRIYEPFVTGRDSEEGLGLGLSIVRNLVQALGGEIKFRSREPGGTVFKVSFPPAHEESCGGR